MKSHKAVPILVTLYILIMFASPAFAAVIYVDADATSGANNGESWANAYIDLQDGLSAAVSGDEIWVAAGTYKPTTTTDRTISFVMKDGVGIYGGFAGIETALAQRDWQTKITILSGNIGDLSINTDNSYHVINNSGTNITSTSVLDGFTISGGRANGRSPYNYGGGMYNDGSSPTITNCTFFANSAIYYGGGILNLNSSSPMISNCTFSMNTANKNGGGMSNNNSSPMISNCTFFGNTTSFGIGSGMDNANSSNPTISNCTFSCNTNSTSGSGMANNNNSNPTITNCIFSGNTAFSSGAGMDNFSSSPTITNCTFSGNTAASEGGGMYNSNSSNPTLTNCTFSGNTITYYGLSTGGGGMYNEHSCPVVINCIFSGNTSNNNGGGIYNRYSSPTITNCAFSENTANHQNGGGMYNHLKSNPAVINCTFWGNTATNNGGGMYNSNSSSPMITNCTFWGNTATNNGGGICNYMGGSSIIINCILWNNSPDQIIRDTFSTTPSITYSIVEGGYTGTGNLDADPLFVDSSSGNFRLKGTSPAIDAGNSAIVTIATDLGGNPRIGGAAVDMGAYELAPEINVKQGTTNIASGGSYNFGNVTVGSDSGAITFTIENTGTADLSLSGVPKVAVSGVDAADFSVDETSTTSPVTASGTTTFTVTFTPSSAIAETATISIANDDSDENPYTVTLTSAGTDGTTIPPVIPGLPLPIVITTELSDITATGAASGGNVVYPEGCTALLVGRGIAWDTVSPPTYPQDSHTFDGWASGKYNSTLTDLVPQTKYYIRAYVMYKLHNVVYTRYSEYIYNFTTPALPGDVNGDKVLDLKDAILSLKIVAGVAGNAAINLPADVNSDGKIGIEEAVYVLQHIGSAG